MDAEWKAKFAWSFLLPPIVFSAWACLLLWPLALCPNCLPFAPGAAFSDLLISHLPNAEYWRTAVLHYGQWPLWNAQLFAGQPFAADPLAGVWYPPNLLLLVLPLPLAINLLLALHLAWAGYGLFRFLRAEGLPDAPAFLGGLAFAGTPKLLAHLGAGHVSLVLAIAWTPWLLGALRSACGLGGLKHGALAGAILGLIVLADPRWAFYAGVLVPVYGLWQFFRRDAPTARLYRTGLGVVLMALLISAVLWLPMMEFVLHSNRRALTLDEAALYSLPPYYLIGLFIPPLGGFHEWMTYLGVVPLLLAILSAVCADRRVGFWWAAVVVAALFSLGSHFVLFSLLFRLLPGLTWLRVPSRAWFIVTLGVSILAAHGLHRLVSDLLPRLRVSPALPNLRRWIPSARAASIALIVFALVDAWRVDSTLVEARPRPERAPAAEWIAAQMDSELWRVYSPSYSLPLDDGLPHVDGVNPLQLADSVQFIERASGVRATSYSVTLPAFNRDDLATANANAVPDAHLLGLLNVKYVAAEFDLIVPELKLVQTFGRTRIYENLAFRPRAWVDDRTPAEVRAWSPGRIELRARGPGRLTLSEVDYPGWQAWVDGVRVETERVEDLLIGVRLDEGDHDIVVEFRPPLVFVGLGLSVLGLVGLAFLWLRK